MGQPLEGPGDRRPPTPLRVHPHQDSTVGLGDDDSDHSSVCFPADPLVCIHWEELQAPFSAPKGFWH